MRQQALSRPHWVFADSSGYYAAAVRRDENFHAAQTMLASLEREHARLFTTRYVLAETHALIVKRQRDPRGALTLLNSIEQARSTTIVSVTDADEANARAILTRYQDHLFTLTDAISFAVMERLGITRVFSFDRDFVEYGFP